MINDSHTPDASETLRITDAQTVPPHTSEPLSMPHMSKTARMPDASEVAHMTDAQTFRTPEPLRMPDASEVAHMPHTSETARMPDAIVTLRQRFRNHTPGLMDAKRAYAVLCPLVDAPDGPELLFEVRAAGIRQPGEVCFPGGRIEPGETPLECALRETEEELSIPRACVEPLGRMDFICNQRGFLLHPVPGFVRAEGLRCLQASAAEVSETFTAPLAFFRDTPPEVYAYELVPRPPDDFPYDKIGVPPDYPWARGRVTVPVWYWRGHAIWGMTARIIAYLVNGL